ncbi:MAG: hypothetical protein WCA46_23795 [Actinocatenispora sp.]
MSQQTTGAVQRWVRAARYGLARWTHRSRTRAAAEEAQLHPDPQLSEMDRMDGEEDGRPTA